MKLVTWNTQSCTGLDGEVSPARIVECAQSLCDFDVLCLQEIAVQFPALTGQPDADQTQEIAALLPGFRVFFGAAVDTFHADGRRGRFGNMIATRLPVAEVQHHPLPFPADPDAQAMRRMCTVVTVLDPDHGPVRIMTTHLEFYSRRQRLAQAHALRALHLEYFDLAQSPPRPKGEGLPNGPKQHTAEAILCGDFNCHPGTEEYAALVETSERSTLWDAWRLVHGETPHAPTFCVHDATYLPQPLAFDFVLVSDGLKDAVRRLEVDGETRASDHQPVLLELGAS